MMSPRKCLVVSKEVTCNATVVRFPGEKVSLDQQTSRDLFEQLIRLADEPTVGPLLLDFGNVDFVSCAGLGTLVRVGSKLHESGRDMAIANLSPNVREVLAAAKLDEFLQLRSAENGNWPIDNDGVTDAPAVVTS